MTALLAIFVGVATDFLAFIIVAFLLVVIFWQRKMILYALGVPLAIIYGLSLASGTTVNSGLWIAGIVIALIGTYFIYQIALEGIELIRKRKE